MADYIVISALLGAGVALMEQPFDLGLFVVLVVSMGMGGAVAGAFLPLPRSDQRALVRREAEHRGTLNADDHQDGAPGESPG